MNARFSLIRNYSLLIAAILAVSFMVVAGVLVFYFVQVDRLKVRTADFHLATIQSTFRIKEVLFQLRSEVSVLRRGYGARPPVADGAAPDSPLDVLHFRGLVQVITPALTSILELQREFGGDRFEATVRRAKAHCDRLTESLAGPSPLSGDGIAEFLTTISALDLSLSQLERLHSIAYEDAADLYDRNTRLANSILVPSTIVIIFVGIFALRYFIRQIGAALGRQAVAEAELSRLNAELGTRVERRTAELRSAEEELVRKERLAAIGQVTATVSHELRNPLGAIRTGLDAVKALTGGSGPQVDRAIALVDRSMARCDRIITELLNFTRVQHLNWESTRIDDWLGEVLDECDLTPGVTLRHELGSGVESPLDRERLRRAMLNVIHNACQAMENGAESDAADRERRLTVASRRVDGRLEISVDDTGHGIGPVDLAKVFEPLYSTKAIGVGLGLPMVKQIAEQHGGGVELSSTPGRGTEVVLWLPLPEAGHGAQS